jgi:hypothetical protein
LRARQPVYGRQLWKERKAWLADEEAQQHLRTRSDQAGYQRDSPVDTAVGQVYESVADDVSHWRGILSGSPEAMQRIRDRARLRATPNPLDVHVDRHGRYYSAFGDALNLAMAFCAAEPSTVLVDVETTERKWAQEARLPGEDYMAGLLNEYRASWALIRQWAGPGTHDVAALEAEGVLCPVNEITTRSRTLRRTTL